MAITLNGTSGITGPLTPPAGTTSVAPLDFTSGTNLSTPLAGAMEYDGNRLMFTPVGTQRGVVPGMQFYCLQTARTFATSTSVVSLFDVGVTLSSSTVYAFESLFVLQKTNTTTAICNVGFGGTATVNNILYQTLSVFDPGTVPLVDSNNNMAVINTTAMTGFTISASVGVVTAFMTGTVSVNAGGTFIPQYSQTAAGTGTTTHLAGSYFRIYPIGVSGSNISVGTWA